MGHVVGKERVLRFDKSKVIPGFHLFLGKFQFGSKALDDPHCKVGSPEAVQPFLLVVFSPLSPDEPAHEIVDVAGDFIFCEVPLISRTRPIFPMVTKFSWIWAC